MPKDKCDKNTSLLIVSNLGDKVNTTIIYDAVKSNVNQLEINSRYIVVLSKGKMYHSIKIKSFHR
jgi:hypothetical protein